jgi:drug/metabolite transporter (DMT)-like permease
MSFMSRGIRYMVYSTLCYAMLNLCVKFLPNIPSAELILFRSLISGTICLIALWRLNIPIFGKNKPVLIARGIFGVMALLLYFSTIQQIPLASAVTIQYLSPIFTTALATVFLNEKTTPKQWAFFLISLIGVFVIKGWDERIPFEYLLVGIGGAVFSGLAYNAVRKLNTSEHSLVIILYFPLVAIPVTGIYSMMHWVWPEGWQQWALILAMGLFTQGGQVYMTKAIQQEELSDITYINYLGVFYALALGYFFFDETYSLWSYLGMALVMLGVVLNLRFSHKKKKRKKALEAQAKQHAL